MSACARDAHRLPPEDVEEGLAARLRLGSERSVRLRQFARDAGEQRLGRLHNRREGRPQRIVQVPRDARRHAGARAVAPARPRRSLRVAEAGEAVGALRVDWRERDRVGAQHEVGARALLGVGQLAREDGVELGSVIPGRSSTRRRCTAPSALTTHTTSTARRSGSSPACVSRSNGTSTTTTHSPASCAASMNSARSASTSGCTVLERLERLLAARGGHLGRQQLAVDAAAGHRLGKRSSTGATAAPPGAQPIHAVESCTRTPQRLNHAATVDLPIPIEPVSPTTTGRETVEKEEIAAAEVNICAGGATATSNVELQPRGDADPLVPLSVPAKRLSRYTIPRSLDLKSLHVVRAPSPCTRSPGGRSTCAGRSRA